MKQIEDKLPDKPSELLEMALGDLRECAEDPAYRLDSSRWFSYRGQYDSNGRAVGEVCLVCLGGAVMAKRLPCELGDDDSPTFLYEMGTIGEGDKNKLHALDDFRTGDFADAFKEMGTPISDGQVAELKELYKNLFLVCSRGDSVSMAGFCTDEAGLAFADKYQAVVDEIKSLGF